MNCCDDFGQCKNGAGCAARSAYPTLREQVEKEMRVARFTRASSRVPKAAPGAPSHWPKTIEALLWWLVIVALFSALAGYFAEVLQ